MPFNESLATRITTALRGINNISEKKMFGGLCFLYKGKMCCGIIKDELVVRVVQNKFELALKNKHAREMDFTGKPMKEFLFVAEEGFRTEKQLMDWINLGLEHAKKSAAKK